MAATSVEAPVVNPAKVDVPCVKPVSSSTCPCASRCASPCVSPCQQVANDASPERQDFSAFVSEGYVSPVGGDARVPVRILRDTVSFDSFEGGSVLPFSQYSDTGDRILMCGMGLNVLPVPMHKLILDCGFVKGEVTMGVRPALPVQGVHILLGNQLAGSRVFANLPSLVVTATPVSSMPDKNVQCFPDVFSACAVTCAMSKDQPEFEVEECVTKLNVGSPEPFPSSLFVSRSDLASEQ